MKTRTTSGFYRKVFVTTYAAVLLLLASSPTIIGQTPVDPKCDALRQLPLDHAHVVATEFVPGGQFQPPTGHTEAGLPPFCRISAISNPSPESNIRIEVWLPKNDWNNRLLGTGNGGGGGAIPFGALAIGVRRGFATVTTDLGTAPNANQAVDSPGRWDDFGHRATHEMTVIARLLAQIYYGRSATHAYFTGCSTGGHQALSEAEHYPEDYDGIIAGAPANNRTHLHSEFLWDYQAAHATTDSQISPERLAFVTRSILAACAGKDGGAAQDQFLTDPRQCKFDPNSLPLCSADRTTNCVSRNQRDALAKIYAGPTNPKTGERIYEPLPFGAESSGLGIAFQESDSLVHEQMYPFFWAFGARWQPMAFSFDSDEDTLDKMLAQQLNANNANLSKFQSHGGKLIMYTGTADPIVPFSDAITYYERVVGNTHPASGDALAATQQFFRYYLAPGMAHCGGGTGVNNFGQGLSATDNDLLFRLEQWVEKDLAPEQILAKGHDPSRTPADFERNLCPYPELPDYTGGDPSSATSFHCTAHARGVPNAPAPRYQR